MAYEPIHHKYRPQTFKDLVGQETIALTLTNALKQEKIATAYLFTGPRGTGKTSSARILAKSLNCLTSDRPTPDPCGKCEACLTIAKGTALDTIEIDAASNTGVDNIREIIERSRFAPVQCRYKIYAIDECHMLSTAAFNALLKTLEEPPPRVVFILATTDPQRVLSTIISRCQRFDYRRIPLPAMVGHLKYIAERENIAIADDAITLIAQIANGGLRDAESLLDQLSLLPDTISVEKVWDLVGAVPEQDLLKLLHAINNNDSLKVLQQCRSLLDRGREPIVVLQNLASFYLNLLIAKTAPQHPEMVAVTETCWQQLCDEGANWDTSLILQGQQHLKEAETQLKRTTQPRLWLEVTLLGLLPKAHQVITTQPAIAKTVNNVSDGDRTQETQAKSTQVSISQKQQQQPQSTQETISPSTKEAEKPLEKPPAKSLEAKPQSTQVTPVVQPAPEAIQPVEPEPQKLVVASDFDIEDIWQKVVSCLHPPTTQALLKQQCHLIDFDGSSAIVGISSAKLQKLNQGKIPNIEKAFAQVVGQKVKVQLEVATNNNSAGNSAKKNSKSLGSLDNATQKIDPPTAKVERQPVPIEPIPISNKVATKVSSETISQSSLGEPTVEPQIAAPPLSISAVATPPLTLVNNSSPIAESSPSAIGSQNNLLVDETEAVNLHLDDADSDYEDDALQKAIANLTHSFEGELVEIESTLDENADLANPDDIASMNISDSNRPDIEDYDDDW